MQLKMQGTTEWLERHRSSREIHLGVFVRAPHRDLCEHVWSQF